MKVLSSQASMEALCRAMDKSNNVFFTRFGDNDIMMMSGTDTIGEPLGRRAYGGNRTKFSEGLQEDLIKAFSINDPNYLKGVSLGWETEPGMTEGIFKSFSYKDGLAKKIEKLTKEEEFMLPVLFQYIICFNQSLMDLFIHKYVKGKKILFIGSVRKKKAELLLGRIEYYVKTPETGAYEAMDEWYPQVENIIKSNDIDIVIPNCGQCGRVIQGRIWGMGTFHSIDMGSIFDPLEGKTTRTWIKKVGNRVREHYGIEPMGGMGEAIGQEKQTLLEYKPKKKKLAILIPTLKERHPVFQKTYFQILHNINKSKYKDEADIIVLKDKGQATIGSKRNELIAKASGFEYIAFFDDDDQPMNNYPIPIIEAIKKNPGIDCVTFNGIVTVNGSNEQEYNFDIKCKEYVNEGPKDGRKGKYVRPPGHLCAIKRSIAVDYKFNNNERGSDVHWAMDIVRDEAIKTAAHVNKPLYHYRRSIKQYEEAR